MSNSAWATYPANERGWPLPSARCPPTEPQPPEILRGLRAERGLQFLETFVRYLLDAGEGIDPEDLRAVAETTFPERGEELMATIGEKLRSEGREQGLQEGRQQGRQEGRHEGRREGRREARQEERAQMLVELVEAGPLAPPDARKTMQQMLHEGKITEAQAETVQKRLRKADAE